MKLEDVLDQWKSDAVMKPEKMMDELFRTPILHSKYVECYVFFKAKLAAAEKKHNKMMWVKRKYFRGEFDQSDLERYGWSQWQGLKPNGQELSMLLEADSDMNDLAEQVTYYKTAVTSIEYILKQIQGRDWALKSAIEYQKYLAGN